ncbi:hypothetical protein ES705_43529 [subsurface metagenome]
MFDKKEYNKNWRKNNPEKVREGHKNWRKNNPEKVRESNKNWRKSNPEKVRENRKRWKKNNPEKVREQKRQWFKKYYIDNREKLIEQVKQWKKDRRKTDLKFNLNYKIGKAIGKALKGNKEGRHWETIVGYTLNDLKKRLNKTMPIGYTWQDFLSGKLHIDHIIPINAFNFNNLEHTDFKRCWALKNLRLLPARENLIKHSKLDKPFQPALRI